MKEIITSAQNERIKEIIRLRKPRERRKQDLIIIEGRQEIELARQAGLEITEVFYCQDFAGNKKIASLPEEKLASVIPAVFEKISYRENPDGFLALAKPKYLELGEVKLSKNPLIIILESLEKPGNLGAILRSADAAGADAVIVADSKTDIYNPNVIRASLGTVFTNQVAVSGGEEIKKWLKDKKIKSFAATPEAEKLYTEVNYKGAVAFIMGEEHPGLSKDWLDAAKEKIRIPMAGKINSLNVSVSTAIILFEAIRQRNKK